MTSVMGQFFCTPSFTYTANQNGQVIFNNTSTYSQGPVTYIWSFGDGTTDTVTNPTHVYNGLWSYTVCLTIVTPNCTAIFCDSVSFAPACISDFSYTTNQLAVAFYNYSSTNFTQWEWTFGDGNSSSLYSPNYTYSTNGNYTVCLVGIDTVLNCTDTICKNITIFITVV